MTTKFTDTHGESNWIVVKKKNIAFAPYFDVGGTLDTFKHESTSRIFLEIREEDRIFVIMLAQKMISIPLESGPSMSDLHYMMR